MAKIKTMEIPVWQAWIAMRLGINPRELTDTRADGRLETAIAKHPKFPGTITLTEGDFVIESLRRLNGYMTTTTTRIEAAGSNTVNFNSFMRAYLREGEYNGNSPGEKEAYLEGQRARTLWDNKEVDVPLS